ncbi:MAG: hypothetical protein ABWZ80_00870 [Beijerinckiaceae bacterium]
MRAPIFAFLVILANPAHSQTNGARSSDPAAALRAVDPSADPSRAAMETFATEAASEPTKDGRKVRVILSSPFQDDRE